MSRAIGPRESHACLNTKQTDEMFLIAILKRLGMYATDGVHVEVTEHHLTRIYMQDRAALLPVDVATV